MNLLTTTEAKAIRDLLTVAGTACIDVVFESGVRVYNVPKITVKAADALHSASVSTLHPHDVGQRFETLEDFCAAYIPSETPALPYKEGDVCEFNITHPDGTVQNRMAQIYAITNFDSFTIAAIDVVTGGHHILKASEFVRVVRSTS